MRYRFAAGAIVLALLGGCAQDGSDRADPLSASTLESFRLLMYQPRDLALAEHRLIQRCMRAQGLEYPARAPAPARVAASLLDLPPRFTVEQARGNGYGDTIRRGSTDQPDRAGNPVDRYLVSLSPADQERYRRALDDPRGAKTKVKLPGGGQVGTSSRSCRGKARAQTYGSLENYLTITYLPQVAQTQVQKLESDRALRRSLDAYANCMSGAGYQAGTPTAAAELAATYYQAGADAAARQREVTLAVQDATCQGKARVHAAFEDAVNRIAASWIAEHEAAVLAAAEAQKSAVDRARKVLDES
jgi:hypothetical protein